MRKATGYIQDMNDSVHEKLSNMCTSEQRVRNSNRKETGKDVPKTKRMIYRINCFRKHAFVLEPVSRYAI